MQTLESSVNPQSDEFQGNTDAMNEHVQTFRDVEQKVLDLAEAAREKFAKRGKLLPRDRINRLLDRGTPFLELCSLAGYKMHDDKDGSMAGGNIIAGIGTVSGIRCLVVASNCAIKGGTITPAGLDKTLRLQQIAKENKLPVVSLSESGGASELRYRYLRAGRTGLRQPSKNVCGRPSTGHRCSRQRHRWWCLPAGLV